MTTTGNGNCVAVNDQVLISFTPAPVVNAGAAVSLCANNAHVTSERKCDRCDRWSMERRRGHIQPEQHDPQRDLYTHRCGDRGGHVDVSRSPARAMATVYPVASNKVITFTPAPTVNAGPNGTVCANNSAHHLGRFLHRSDRCGMERWNGNLRAEQHYDERGVHTECCGTHRWHGDPDTHHRRQWQLQRGKQQCHVHDHACSNSERRRRSDRSARTTRSLH